MKQFVLILFLAILVIAIKSPVSAGEVSVASFKDLKNALNSDAVTEVVLHCDIELTQPLMVTKSVSFTSSKSVSLYVPHDFKAFRHLSVRSNDKIVLDFKNITLDGAGSGGGIECEAPSLTVNGAVFKNCVQLENDGGSIYFKGTSLMLSNTDILSSRGRKGGAVYTDGSATLKKTTISNCRSSLEGGGLFVKNYSSVLISECELDTNYSFLSGGGVYFAEAASKGAKVDITTCLLLRSYAKGSGGGAYFKPSGDEGAILNISDTKFYACTSEKDGGGLAACDLSRVFIDTKTVWSNNEARFSVIPTSEEIQSAKKRLKTKDFSQPFDYVINNYDIAYDSQSRGYIVEFYNRDVQAGTASRLVRRVLLPVPTEGEGWLSYELPAGSLVSSYETERYNPYYNHVDIRSSAGNRYEVKSHTPQEPYTFKITMNNKSFEVLSASPSKSLTITQSVNYPSSKNVVFTYEARVKSKKSTLSYSGELTLKAGETSASTTLTVGIENEGSLEVVQVDHSGYLETKVEHIKNSTQDDDALQVSFFNDKTPVMVEGPRLENRFERMPLNPNVKLKYAFEAVNDQGQDVLADNVKDTGYIEVKAGGTGEFGSMRFERPGEYQYLVSQMNEYISGFVYDKTTYILKVNINRFLELSELTLEGTGGEKTEVCTFLNTFKPSDDLSLSITKTIDYPDKEDLTFSYEFELFTKEGKATPLPVSQVEITIKAGKTRGSFNKVFKNLGSESEYGYVLREALHPTYGQPELIQKGIVTMPNAAIIVVFSGCKEQPLLPDKRVNLTLVGDVPPRYAPFRFSIKPLTKDAPLPRSVTNGEQIITLKGVTAGSFGRILFDSPGKYDYRVIELYDNVEGYRYESRVYNRRVEVNEYLEIETDELRLGTTEVGEIIFTNVYQSSSSSEVERVLPVASESGMLNNLTLVNLCFAMILIFYNQKGQDLSSLFRR